MNKLTVKLWGFLLLFSTTGMTQAITVTNTQTPEELVTDVLVGAGVTVSNIEFNHSVPLAGVVQTMAGYFDATGTDFPISEGLVLATGHVRVAEGPNDSGSETDNEGVAPDPDDADLDAIGTATINNEAVLEFDFVPSGDSVSFNYIFGSEEYLEYVDAGYNDVFGFFISGPGFAGPYEDGAENIAVIPGTSIPVTIDNLNNEDYPEFYVNNDGGTAVQYDGHTTVLQANASVVCGETYHIKIAIGDAGDASWDSGVFLEASSFSSNGINVEIASVLGEDAIIEGCDSALISFIRPEEADTIDLEVEFEIGGTAINGTDYDEVDETVFFPEGEDTVQIWIVPGDDGLVEGSETVTITVEIINECGDTILTEATIEITDPLEYDLVMEDITLDCPEDSVMLSFETEGGGFPEFDVSWSSGGTEVEEWVPGDIEGTVTYTVDVVDVCGVPASGSVDVTFDPAPVASIVFNEDLFILCPGQEADIDATVLDVYDADALTYSWDPTGETVEDITAEPAEEGWYYLTIFDGCNTVTDSVKFDFGEVNLTDIDVTNAIDCPGIPGASLGAIVVEPDNPAWTYELVGHAGPQDNGTFNDLAGGINYVLLVTDENGCTKDTIIPLTLGENAVVATWAADSLANISCFGANDGSAYIHSIGGGITPPYDITWTSAAGVFDTALDVPAGSDSDQDNLPGGDWVVTVVDEEGCAWSYTFEITEPDELTMELSSNDPTCFGFSDGSITASTEGGNGGETYTMTNAAGEILNVENSNTINTLPTGWYYVLVEDINGCSVYDSLFLNQPGEMDIDLTINQPLCYGIPTGYVEVDTVYNYTGSYDTVSYYWAPNPSGVEGLDAYFNSHMGDGDYTITINDQNGCSRVFDFTITYPDEFLFQTLDYFPAYCRLYGYQSGNGEVFASATGGTPDYSVPHWTYLVDGTTADQGTWGGRDPGDYAVEITDANGCVLRDTITVDSLNPIASFTVNSDQLNSDLQGTADVEALFTNTSMNFANPKNPGADTTFFWSLYNKQNWVITHDYYETFDTTYGAIGNTYEVEVCLVAQNKNGCTDTACQKITIYEPITLKNVNIFTPNGDGDNDIFTFDFYAKSIAEFECTIVNRWGIKVAELDHITDGWDGTDLNGTPCTDGVYFYTYKAISDNATELTGQGTVTIVGAK